MNIKYTFPRKSFDLLIDVLGREKAGPFAEALESSIDDLVNTKYEIHSNLQKEELKAELTNQLVTKLEFNEKINELKLEFNEKINTLNNKLNILMVIVIILGLTSNPIVSNLILSFIK